MKVLVSGATGFVGSHLVPALVHAGHDVLAMTRRVDDYDGPGTAVAGDTSDVGSMRDAMAGCATAYYLVHGLDASDAFEEKDAEAARRFGQAAADAGVRQVVYLGGLGAEGDDLSDHLASRQHVEGELSRGGVPVTALRAALVIGAGSASFELLRQVVDNLPVLVVPPRAGETLVQPIAVGDAVRYLVGVLALEDAVNSVLEIGGPDVMTYEDMLRRMATRLGKHGPSVSVPVIPKIAAKIGVRAVTDVDPTLAATLLDSLGNDVVVTDARVTRLLPGPLMTFDEMLDAALAG